MCEPLMADEPSLPRYQPFYCEENIWHLARQLAAHAAWVVFISNRARRCLLLGQRAGEGPARLVVWDYHVVLVTAEAGGAQVWDLDCVGGAPLPVKRWIDETFALVGHSLPSYDACFRVVDAAVFVEAFASDRRHMRGPDGSWQAPPPPWPVIGEGFNLMRWVDLDDGGMPGEVLDLAGLRARFVR
ncbi:MAG: hypothetical protein H6701_16805 [Myxococcales bacterium]|nr:hypothetical protein [Myxococcales bacterium]